VDVTILAAVEGGLEKVVDELMQKLSTIFVVRWSIFTSELVHQNGKRKICHKLAQLQPPAQVSRHSGGHV
jgi:hypothetical protein